MDEQEELKKASKKEDISLNFSLNNGKNEVLDSVISENVKPASSCQGA